MDRERLETEAENPESPPRVLYVDLDRLLPDRLERPSLRSWRGSTKGIDRVGRFSGSALAAALLHEAEVLRPGSAAPLVVSVGDCVRRAIPTAARACVASRAPLTGFYADGQVGSDLGRRLARVTDALVLTGRARRPGSFLHLSGQEDETRIELRSLPALVNRDPASVHRVLTGALGPCAILRIGPAGSRGIPFASLAAGDDPPSFVGRGGLGARLGELGLVAIAVTSAAVEPALSEDLDGANSLARLLARSPRLRARAEGGTLEVADVFAARGDLRERGYSDALPAVDARAWRSGLLAPEALRKGCEGCPTPCGLVFERGYPGDPAGGETGRRGARFGALYALGPNLGLEDANDALHLLGFCDDAGLDAIEAGAALALLARAGRAPWGNVDSWLRLLRDLVERRGDGALLALGASRMARELGLERGVLQARGQSTRREASLAAVLGQCVSARGADPMRTFPFLFSDTSADERGSRLAELLAPIPLPPGASDPLDPAGKGRIVWWHENLMAAIDATGFCAFSAAGLLTDGVCGLDELVAALAPRGLAQRSGRGLLAAGASILTVVRDLNRRWGARAAEDLPDWARDVLVAPGMWPEYAALRGLDGAGGPSRTAWKLLGEEAILDMGDLMGDPGARSEPAYEPRACAARRTQGRVSLRCFGPLARELGLRGPEDLVHVEVDLPAGLPDVLAAAARDHPRASRHLLDRGRPVPAVYRGSRRVVADDAIEAGDVLDLVVALTGGVSLS